MLILNKLISFHINFILLNTLQIYLFFINIFINNIIKKNLY